MRRSLLCLLFVFATVAAAPVRAGEVETLRLQLAAKERELKALQDSYYAARSKNDEEVARDARVVERLASVGRLEARNTELEELLKESEETLGRERQKVNALSSKALDLEKQLLAALERIEELEAQLAALQIKAQGLEVELGTEKKMGEERLGDRDRKIAELEALLSKEKDRASALDKKVLELEARIVELQATVESTKDALNELQKRKAEADARIAEFKGLIDKFKSLIDAGKLRVKIVEGRMVVELATDILFGSGSATLSRTGRDAIKEVAEILASIPERTFQIEGHTDNVPIKTAQFPSNWELAAARAINVVSTMVVSGMPAERISAASYADVKPAVSNETKEGRASNRRIEIVVVPDLSSLPGFEELNRVATTPEL